MFLFQRAGICQSLLKELIKTQLNVQAKKIIDWVPPEENATQ